MKHLPKVKKSPDEHDFVNNVCSRCGCIKENIEGDTIYWRSGFSSAIAPVCIDWEIEDNKTID